MNAFLVALTLIGLTINSAHAADLYPTSTMSILGRSNASQEFSVIPSDTQMLGAPTISDLVNADVPELDTPDFPRLWTRRDIGDVIKSNTKFGTKIPVVDLGGKLSIEFRYNLKTTFFIISSTRKKEKNSHGAASKTAEAPTQSDEVLNFDETTMLTYPKVLPGYPMVGICVYEASLDIEKTVEGGFDFIIGEKFEKGKLNGMGSSRFSNYFQLRGDIPVKTYLESVCGNTFKKQMEPSVINDLSKMVMEVVIGGNLHSDCTPSRSVEDVENGDASCMAWHQDFPENIRHLTVPRCMLQHTGVHRCRLKAREGTACDMYVDPVTKTFKETFKSFDRTILATEDNFAYSCDKKLGLSCIMEKEPTLLRGVPLMLGRARCQSTHN